MEWGDWGDWRGMGTGRGYEDGDGGAEDGKRGRENEEGTWGGGGSGRLLAACRASPGWASHPPSALPAPWQPGILTPAVLKGTCSLGSLERLSLNTNDLPEGTNNCLGHRGGRGHQGFLDLSQAAACPVVLGEPEQGSSVLTAGLGAQGLRRWGGGTAWLAA